MKNKNNDDEQISFLRTTAMVASLGNIFCDTQAEKNAWKVRMLKAGLEKKGLSFPADFDSLPEDEKERRLNAVIKLNQEVSQ